MAEITWEITWESIESSNLEAVGFDKDDLSALYIRFKSGAVYRYENVPDDIYEGLMNAGPKGKFLNEQIKGVYVAEKIS